MQSDGSFLVTFVRENLDGTSDVVGRKVSSSGSVGSEFTIFDSGDVESIVAEAATLSNGNYVVAYQNYVGTGDHDVDYKIFTAAGLPVAGPGVQANALDPEDASDVQIAALAGGGFVAVWQTGNDGSGVGIKAGVFDNEYNNVKGGATGFIVNTTTGGIQYQPDVTALKDGGFLVTWIDGGTVQGQRYDASGNKVGSEFDVSSGGTKTDPTVASLGDGRVIFGYLSGAPFDVQAAIFDPRTSPINGTSSADVLTSRKDGATVNGLGGSDTLLGQGANDTLDGGTGADEMRGRAGNDTYIVDNAGDKVIESSGQGTDTVKSSVSFVLGSNVENLTLLEPVAVVAASGDINATGNSLANTLTGNSGNNILDGKGGADTMSGKAGNDTYVVDNAGDKVIESAGQGTDTVKSSIAYTLGDNLEKLVLTGSADINGTGNGLANTLVGNAGRNTLDGGDGDDILSGGPGKDKLLGRKGKDVFVFADDLSKANADKVVKFKHGKDTFFLAQDKFAAVGAKVGKKEFVEGAKAQDKNDHIIRKGKKIFYDEDGKGGTKQVLFAKVDKKAVIDHHDFEVGDFVI
ncbi:MAG: calcium-binding protein [Bauldia sp.]|nr:calcium-binding protein [Bauldia sp.]